MIFFLSEIFFFSCFFLLRRFLISITRGRGSKKGPIHNKTLTRMPQDIKLASWVRPPTVCWIRDLEREAVNGMQEKKDPTRFPIPWKWLRIVNKDNLLFLVNEFAFPFTNCLITLIIRGSKVPILVGRRDIELLIELFNSFVELFRMKLIWI